MKKNIFQITILHFLIAVLVALSFCACNSKSFKAVQAINNGYDLDSVAADKRAKEIAPCVTISQDTTAPIIIETTTTDTIVKIVTDTVKLQCDDGSFVDTVITKKYYDINHRITKTNTFYITKTIEDKGKDIMIREVESRLTKQESKTDFWKLWSIISTMLFLLTVIFLFIKNSFK